MLFGTLHPVFAHLIGDYLIQTDSMARKKKVSNWWCCFHVFSYMVPFLFVDIALWQFYLIAGQHYFQDRTQFVKNFLIWKGSSAFAEPPMAPWSIILTDNIIHILWIYIILSF